MFICDIIFFLQTFTYSAFFFSHFVFFFLLLSFLLSLVPLFFFFLSFFFSLFFFLSFFLLKHAAILKERLAKHGGGSRIFIGGGTESYVPACTLQARNRTHFRQGSRARLLKGPGSSRVVLMLSRAI